MTTTEGHLRYIACLLLFAAPLAHGQSAISFQFDPQVIVPGQTTTVLLQIQVAGSPSRVTYESAQQRGVEVDMKDDGTGGDRTAGDNVYTISLAAGPIVSAMRPDDVYRPFVGLFYLYNGATRVVTGGVNAEVADAAIQRLPVTNDALDVQHTDYVVNILMPQAFPLDSRGVNVARDMPRVLNRFYQLFPDDFDVVNVVYIPSFFLNRGHDVVRNAVQGIGIRQFDTGQAYGSRARLQGISVFPISSLFDGADLGFQHEFGHQWINYLNVEPVASGIPHWPLSTMASGIMGWNGPGGIGAAGNFNCVIVSDASGVHLLRRNAPIVFSDMELYLMGLLPPEQVGEQIVLNQDIPDHYCTTDSLYTGTVTRFHVADLIANPAVGPRVPSAATAQKHFRLATILVTRDALLDDDAMAFYSLFAQRAELRTPVAVHVSVFGKTTDYPFALSTRGLGTMTTRITDSGGGTAPAISSGGPVNGASFAPGPVAPGSIASLFGTNLASSPEGAGALPLPNLLAGTSALLGGHAVPLFFVSPGQMNIQVPWELAGQTQALLTVTAATATGTRTSSPQTVNLATFAPGIFQLAGGQGIIVIANTATIAVPVGSIPGLQTRPAHPGEFLSIYATGLGPVTNQPPSGTLAPGNPRSLTTTTPSVTIGELPAPVRSSGLTPGFAGLYQVDVQVPLTVAGGNAVQVVLSIGGATSNTVTIAVQ